MSVDPKVFTQIDQLKRILADVPKGTPKALAGAMNRSMLSARTVASKETRARYNVKASDIKAATRIQKANYSTMQATLVFSEKARSLMKFDPSSKSPTQYPTIVSVKVKKKRSSVKGGFIASGPKGGTTMFKREGKTRLPIAKLHGPSIPQMVGNESVVDKMGEKLLSTLETRLDHEVDRLLAGHYSGETKNLRNDKARWGKIQ